MNKEYIFSRIHTTAKHGRKEYKFYMYLPTNENEYPFLVAETDYNSVFLCVDYKYDRYALSKQYLPNSVLDKIFKQLLLAEKKWLAM